MLKKIKIRNTISSTKPGGDIKFMLDESMYPYDKKNKKYLELKKDLIGKDLVIPGGYQSAMIERSYFIIEKDDGIPPNIVWTASPWVVQSGKFIPSQIIKDIKKGTILELK